MDPLFSKLLQSGLSEQEAQLYLFIRAHPNCAVSDARTKLQQSKSSIYRAFEGLKEKNLIQVCDYEWKYALRANPLESIAQMLEDKQQQDAKLIRYFKSLGQHASFGTDQIEILDEEETYERYLQLSEMEWDTMLAFGNWEDLNNKNRNLISIEKKFIANRLKNGGNALVSLTKGGDHTYEIIDHRELDERENRITRVAKVPLWKPFWVNAFEGNDYVQLWNLDDQDQLYSTFINSSSISTFYKDLIRSNML